VPRGLRQLVLSVLPRRYHLPLRYYYRRWFHTLDPEFRFLTRLVGRGQTAVDVGGNLGVYTYALSKLCRRVEVFEPVSLYADLIRAFPAPNVRVHEVALSSQVGTQRLYFAREAGLVDMGRGSLSPLDPGSDSLETRVDTLDNFGLADVSFIKIDVEGHELDVLKGATETLTRQRPNLLVEIEQRHLQHPMKIVFDYLEGLGYHGFFVEGRALHPIGKFQPEQHQRLENVYSERYINNFLFFGGPS
jgi:FkbM family methyltransferase